MVCKREAEDRKYPEDWSKELFGSTPSGPDFSEDVCSEYKLGFRLNPHTDFTKGGWIFRRVEAFLVLLVSAVLALICPTSIYLTLYQKLGTQFCRPVPNEGEGPKA